MNQWDSIFNTGYIYFDMNKPIITNKVKNTFVEFLDEDKDGFNFYEECNDKNPKQLFKLEHIMNESAYSNNIDSATPFDNVDKSSISYPFAMLRSVNNDNCLTNNHGTLTVQPCYSFIAQRWMPL